MINSRKLEDLDPKARAICELHIEKCKSRGVEIIVTSTWRDYESQDALYAIGRSVELSRGHVTNAHAGQSWHNFRVAWDVVPVVMGKPVWDPKDPTWKIVIISGKEVGAEPGAEWKTFPDLPHFQYRPSGLTMDEAKKRFDSTGSVW